MFTEGVALAGIAFAAPKFDYLTVYAMLSLRETSYFDCSFVMLNIFERQDWPMIASCDSVTFVTEFNFVKKLN